MNCHRIPLGVWMGGLACLAMTGALWGQGVSGTAHDFSDVTISGELCSACHVPHNADPNPPAPLWQGGTVTATFKPYASPSLDATVGQPDGVSKACLTCHDGSVALDRFGGGGGGSARPSPPYLLTTDLSNDHPISFVYDASLAARDGELAIPASTTQVDPAGRLRLFQGKLQCATCHDPHDNTHGAFLVMGNSGSTMCLSCHLK